VTAVSIELALEAAVLSDTGTERPDNQDSGHYELIGESGTLVVLADGVSGLVGGATASRMAVETTFQAYKEQAPHLSLMQRLSRAVQQANIAVYDFAVVVTDLRGMSTTLTAIAVDRGELAAVHVGDSRLYLVRDRTITQLTKDHTVTGDKIRAGLLSQARARHHPDRSTLTRSLGRELIVGLDRFTRRVRQGDAFVLCTDGLYNTLEKSEIARIVCEHDASSACRELVNTANQIGTVDNLTAAVVRIIGPVPGRDTKKGLLGRLRSLVRSDPRG
jgi:PPM family protein phosphatase